MSMLIAAGVASRDRRQVARTPDEVTDSARDVKRAARTSSAPRIVTEAESLDDDSRTREA
jgi:hypothetical protein